MKELEHQELIDKLFADLGDRAGIPDIKDIDGEVDGEISEAWNEIIEDWLNDWLRDFEAGGGFGGC